MSSIFGASVEQLVYDEMWLRSEDTDFRAKIKIPQMSGKNWANDRERWQRGWSLSIHHHYGLPHIEASFWIGSY